MQKNYRPEKLCFRSKKSREGSGSKAVIDRRKLMRKEFIFFFELRGIERFKNSKN